MARDAVYVALLQAARKWHDDEGEPKKSAYYSSLDNAFLASAEEAYWEAARERGWHEESAKRKKPPSKPKQTDEDPLYGFEDFWLTYPRRNGKRLNKQPAQGYWKKLTIEEKRAAWRGARNYATDVEAGLQTAKDAFRWLRDHCWTEWQEYSAPLSPQGSPAYDPDQFSVFDEARDRFENGRCSG